MDAEEKIVKPITGPKSPEVVEEAKPEVVEKAEADSGDEKDDSQKPDVDAKDDYSEKPEIVSPEDYYLTSPLFHKVADYFGLEKPEWEMVKNKLSVIVDWAILESGSDKAPDILGTISHLENILKPPGLSEKRHNIVYRYVRLLGQKRNIDREMSVYKDKING